MPRLTAGHFFATLSRMKLRPTLAALLLTLTAGAAVAPLDGIDPAGVDPAIRPQDDLYRATNGRWLANTPIPADLANIGAFSLLAEKALDDQRAMLEEVAALGAQAPASAIPAPAQADSPSIWGSGLLKTALAAGLGAAAGTVLADQASSWLSSDELDLGD